MKTQPCCYVYIQVRMVHHMETPQQRHTVEHDVLAVDNQVKAKDSNNHPETIREGALV